MALSAFDDRSTPPDDRSLQAMLGRTGALWTQLTERLHAAHDPLTEDWGFAGAAYGWSLRLKKTKRALVYLTPCRGHFLASFALGEKACTAAREHGLPRESLDRSDAAKNRMEMLRVVTKWDRQLDPVRFIESGEEPNSGYEPLAPAPKITMATA